MKILLALLLLGYSLFSSAQVDTTRMFIFGHSLIDHRPPAIATPSDETTVPHWMYLISTHENYEYAAGGQYGFLPQHSNLPPISQWGYDIVPGVWESDTEPFSDADISHVLITAGNFMQWQGPGEEYPSDPGVTPINATEDIVDWVNGQEDSVRIYIYENWPDMAPFLNNGFPPSSIEFENYNDYTINAFHDWWIDYHDSLLISRPNVNVRMIPVGIIMSKLFTDVLPNLIPISDLYEDDAPHGRASLYFLAGLITHMAIYEEKVDYSFDPGTIVHPVLRDSLETIIDFTWRELINFNDVDGNNRVFYNYLTGIINLELTTDCISVYPNPTNDHFNIKGDLSDYTIQIIDAFGTVYQTLTSLDNIICVDINTLPSGQYFITATHSINNTMCVQKIIKD